MEFSELSSTPSSVQHQSILVNAEGNPLKINLQAVELEGRPKLVRTLKGSGALVVSNAKEAAIILVDSATESGKRLIRTWGHDASKVVLEHTWVRTSVNAGRALLAIDNWGGAMTIDDGRPVTIDGVVVDEDELEEVEALVTKSPLPTPRVTPVDPTTQRPEITAEHVDTTRLEIKPDTSVPDAIGRPLSAPPVAQPTMVGSALSEEPKVPVSTCDDIPPPQSLQPPSATQPLSNPQPVMLVQPYPSQNTYTYTTSATQQSYPSLQSQAMSTQPFPHHDFTSSQYQVVHAPSQPQVMETTPNTTSVNGVNLQNPNLATLMTIMEVVRHMDQSTWLGQNHLSTSQPPTNSHISTFSVQSPASSGPSPSASTSPAAGPFPYPGADTSLSSSQYYSSDTGTPSQRYGPGREASEDCSATRKSRVKSRQPSDEILTSSTSRKRPSTAKPTHPSLKRPRKGKEKVMSVDSEHSEVNELIDVSNGSCSTHRSASSIEWPRNIAAHKRHGGIFLSESGQPLRFFVQVDLHGRHAVVTKIKKNMGKIVNNIADADYLILSPRSDTFQGLLNEAIALGKSPILAAFVADCVEEGALLDETDYVLESVAKIRALKRGRQNAFSFKIETTETVSHQIKETKPELSPGAREGRKSKGASKVLTEKRQKRAPNSTPSKLTPEVVEDPMGSRSPTPPHASTRQAMKNGKYLFTELEDEYIFRLARHHLSRDPTISNTALVSKLYKKMPHHTAASWAAHIDQKLKGAVEDVRKRANIAKRKRDSEAASRNPPQGTGDEGTPSKRWTLGPTHGNDVSANSSQPSQEELEQQDFDVITQFFALGGGEDDDDERAWKKLERHCPCVSASSWPEYYLVHQKEVYARIEELMNYHAGN